MAFIIFFFFFFLKKFEKVEKTGIISTKFSLRCTPSGLLGFIPYFCLLKNKTVQAQQVILPVLIPMEHFEKTCSNTYFEIHRILAIFETFRVRKLGHNIAQPH